jgi:Asp-tRNA(Asn)/Glu-tRNA(Gln) amidotransferase A subunit family amidase
MTGYKILETTIRQVHQALMDNIITCRSLAEWYFRRIDSYDQSTGLNAIILKNPNALTRAEQLDKEYSETGRLRKLHGVPFIVKDNYDTHDLQTAAGSIALKGNLPPDDAFQVRRIREAGAIIIAKSNMAEWAFSPYQTVSSIAGTTRNPYDLDRVPAGSSGGTAAAVAANFGLVGLGTDTGNSIRGPSSHCSLVGFRSTMGLTSRDGIVPLSLRNDIGGPMCRTVEDAARILSVIAGYDPADPITELCRHLALVDYEDYLDPNGLVDIKIGVFRYYTDKETADREVVKLFNEAVLDLEKAGAVLVDPFVVPDFEKLSDEIWCRTFSEDLAKYLSTLDNPKYKTLKEVVDSGLYSDYIKERLEKAVEAPIPTCRDVYHEQRNVEFREAILKAMKKDELDVFVYPTWSNPPRKIGDMDSPHGDNSQKIPPHTGLPGFTVPMGYTYGNLPSGLQIVGELFDEPTLVKVAYAYEKSTQHRKPPEKFPELK